MVGFATAGWPSQLTESFTGLLPIADGFSYHANATLESIQGYIQGRSSIGGFGNMVIGNITEIVKIDLTTANGIKHGCEVKPITNDDPVNAAWTFDCVLDNIVAGTHYQYLFEVTFKTESNEEIRTQGNLTGVWNSFADALYLPLSEEIQIIFERNRIVRDLLTDHIPVQVLYTAQIDPELPKLGTYVGEVVLLGQTQVNGQNMRYTIATPFAIEGGQLSYWTLSRVNIEKMLSEIVQLPLTKRVMETVLEPELNMWFAEKGDLPELNFLINDSPLSYSTHGEACGDIPAWSVPSDDQPLETFGFNNGWSFHLSDFILLDGRAVVNDLDVWPDRGDRSELVPLLIPNQLVTGLNPPFTRIWMQAEDFIYDEPVLTLWIPENSEPEALTSYKEILDSLPGEVENFYDKMWFVRGLTIGMQEDGRLSIVPCNAP